MRPTPDGYDGTTVLRLPKRPDFVPAGWAPPPKLFEPSTQEKDAARAHGRPVRVSVWDEGLTTIAQARAFRPGPIIVLRAPVTTLRSIRREMGQPLDVVYDTNLDPAHSGMPGAEGHAGIEGLEKGSASYLQWQALLVQLAAVFVPVD